MAEIAKSTALVLSIAGNDSSGKAGLAADSRTIGAFGAHPLSAITATTAQTSNIFSALNPMSSQALESQLSASLSLAPQAIKIGLLASEAQVISVVNYLERYAEINRHLTTASIVYDPVLGSSSGVSFSSKAFVECIKENLIPLCTLLTPNIPETELLLGRKIASHKDVERAAQDLLELGCEAVLIKGGHLPSRYAQDYFCCSEKSYWLSNKRINTPNTRGTGCVLSSAIASSLALGYSIFDASVLGKMAINQGLRASYEVSGLAGPLLVSTFPNHEVDLPVLTKGHQVKLDANPFPPCNEPPLDLYPVVDSALWVERLVKVGVSTIQLRIKDLSGEALESEIIDAIAIAKRHNCRLFINDYWQLAVKHKAYGVHLGQEDLDDADVDAIKHAGLRLGISTHCHYEVARAHSFRPSYIAVGPVFPTTSKDMPWVPHGATGFNYWRQTLDYPLVAIGGITKERIPPLLRAGADSIAMITAITLAENPELTTSTYMEIISEFRKRQ